MIRKCPKCNQYTTGVINRLVYAGIAGRASAKEIEDEGAEIAQGVDDFAKDKLGKYLGSTLGKVGKGAINAASTAVGQARSLAHSVASFLDSEEHYCFKCQNENCKHEWVEPKNEAVDQTSEFYEKCIADFLTMHGRKYLVVNPEASVAYTLKNKTFLLQNPPKGLSFPDNTINYGEIYISHPGDTSIFYSFETYRIKMLEDELNDLKQFLQKLGASSIEIIGMTDAEIANANKSKTSNTSRAGTAAVEANIDAFSERENSEYRRLRTQFKSKVKGERQEFPILDVRLFNKWRNINTEWERIVEMRQNGATEYSFCIETEDITNSKKMELDKVCASYSEFGAGADNNYAKETVSRLKEAKKMSFAVEVIFFPKSAYADFQIIKI